MEAKERAARSALTDVRVPFEKLARLDATRAVPDGWSVVVADVKGSTAAVRSGRYREVNLVGAACVAAVRNGFSDSPVPYVFGGDGALFLVPEGSFERCLSVLEEVRTVAATQMRLTLRVGHVAVREVRRSGGEIRHGTIEYGGPEVLHFFRGNGAAIADREIKRRFTGGTPSALHVPRVSDISGLSCRMLPFEPVRGRIVSVLVEPRVELGEEDEVLSEVLSVLQRNAPLQDLSPLRPSNARRPWLSPSWRAEAQIHGDGPGWSRVFWPRIKTLSESVLGTLLFRLDVENPVTGAPSHYTRRMLLQSDWIKMDGVLRLVIDLTAEEEHELRTTLDRLRAKQKIYYGLHRSGSAVMTCHLQSGPDDKHAHFIDGLGGGLTLAAVELKEQRRADPYSPD